MTQPWLHPLQARAPEKSSIKLDSGWERETRYAEAAAAAAAAAAASVQPKTMLHYILQAERWDGDILDMPSNPEFETLQVKIGKALKAMLRGDVKREIANLEERVLREQGRVLNGTEFYMWIVQQVNRDFKLTRQQILKEISLVKLGTGRNALRNFKAKWDVAVERLVGLGNTRKR
jgi:hypothetical protein